jgi:hypothetical protein
MPRKNENRRKNAERRQRKRDEAQTAVENIRAAVGTDEYIEQVQSIIEKSKLPANPRSSLETHFHIPKPVILPPLPELSLLQQELLGKAMLEQLLGFRLTEKEHRAADAKTSLSEWYAYGYTLYVATYDRLRDLALYPARIKDESQALILPVGTESPEARAEVNQYLNDKASIDGLYGPAAAGYFRQLGDVGLASFLIALPKPIAGKIVLLAIAHMLDSLTQFILEKNFVNDKLENVPSGRSMQGDFGHLLFTFSPLEALRDHVRVLTIPVLPTEFISEFNAIVQRLPQKFHVGNQDDHCNLYPIYRKYYDHLGDIKANYGIGSYSLTDEDISRLDRLPLSEFFLEEMLQSFFALLEAAQRHLLPSDAEFNAVRARASSSVLPPGVSAGQLAAGYTRAPSPTHSKEEKANSTAEITFRR